MGGGNTESILKDKENCERRESERERDRLGERERFTSTRYIIMPERRP